MAWYQVAYAVVQCAANPCFPEGHIAKRPVLYLELVNGDERSSCFAIARQFGFDPLTAPSCDTTGVGDGAVATFYWPVKIDFPGIATFDVYAGFTDGLETIGLGLLGQAGFFDRVKVVFDHKAGLFHLEMPDAIGQ